MKKAELIKHMARQHQQLTNKTAKDVVDGFLREITYALAANRRVELRGLGTFGVRAQPPRNSRNPRTGEAIVLNAQRSVFFRGGCLLKNRVQWALESGLAKKSEEPSPSDDKAEQDHA